MVLVFAFYGHSKKPKHVPSWLVGWLWFMSRTRCVRWKRNARPGPGHGGCFRFFRPPKKQVQHESTRVVLVLCIRVVFFLFCGFRKNKSNIRAPVFFCFFGAAKKTNPIGGHKGCVFPECGAKGSRLTVGVWGPGVCSLAVSACDRARALWQSRWGTLPNGVWVGGREGREEGGGRMGTKGGIRVRGFVLFAFLGLPKKQIQKSKSNTRAEIEGNVCLREKNRAHAGGSPPVPPVRELILYISGSVRFPNCRFLGGFRFARFRFAVRFANLPDIMPDSFMPKGSFRYAWSSRLYYGGRSTRTSFFKISHHIHGNLRLDPYSSLFSGPTLKCRNMSKL